MFAGSVTHTEGAGGSRVGTTAGTASTAREDTTVIAVAMGGVGNPTSARSLSADLEEAEPPVPQGPAVSPPKLVNRLFDLCHQHCNMPRTLAATTYQRNRIGERDEKATHVIGGGDDGCGFVYCDRLACFRCGEQRSADDHSVGTG
jgi:hypothetical protein